MMKRRITMLYPVLFFAVLILFAFTPQAEASGHESEHSGWTAWTSTTSLPSSSGFYYLTADVSLSSAWEVGSGKSFTLCLNGHKITQTNSQKDVIRITDGGTLLIDDCSVGETGMISGSQSSAGIVVSGTDPSAPTKSSVFNFLGGHITGNKATNGGVFVYNGAYACLQGGKIHGNEATTDAGGGVCVYGEDSYVLIKGTEIYNNKSRWGGGVYITNNGKVVMNSGLISNNKCTEENQGGGGVYVSSDCIFEMNGGAIASNTAKGYGGGLYLSVNATARINGGEIRNNVSERDGGGIFKNPGADLSIINTSIYGNTSMNGGGIYSSGSLSLEDSSIHDNTASELGAGVFVLNGNPSVAGRLKIRGNKLTDDTLSNLYIPSKSQTIHVTDELDGDTEICISLANPPAATEKLTLTSGLKEKSGSSVSSPEQVFSFDDWRTYGAIWNDGETEAVVIRIPKCTSLPQDVTAAEGAYATFSVGVSGISVSYQWEYYNASTEEWTEINGATGAKYTTTATAQKNGRLYRVHVMNPVGGFYTASAKLTVASKPVITKQPKTLIVSLNATASFTLTASGTGLSYQWQYSTDDGKTWHDSTQSGAKTASLSVEALSKRNGYQYRCKVKNAAGDTTSVAVQLLISGVKPVIRSQTNAITSAANVTVTFKVSAAGTGLSYQWQYSSDNGKTWHNSSMTGYNTAAMKVPVVSGRNGYLYRCTVKNSYGSVTSSPAKLTVSGVKPVIRDQTKAITSSPNVTVTFKVAAAGVGLKYKWQYSNDGGKTWHDSTMTGYNTAAMKVPVTTARNGYQYRCIVSNSYGSVTSSPAKLTVK